MTPAMRILLMALGAWALLGAFVWGFTRAHAHSWYDGDCCDERDCTEIKGEVQFDAEAFILPSGERVLRKDGPSIRKSMDEKFHVCRYSSGGVRCLYVPRGGQA